MASVFGAVGVAIVADLAAASMAAEGAGTVCTLRNLIDMNVSLCSIGIYRVYTGYIPDAIFL